MPRLRAILMRAALPLVLLASAACYGYRAVETAPRAGARVRVVLTTASTITTFAADGQATRHDGVLELSGTIAAASAEVVSVRLGELRGARGPVGATGASVARVPAELIARIEERQVRAGTTALAGVGVATVAIGAFLIVIIVTLTKAE